jgi:hypothetical protein
MENTFQNIRNYCCWHRSSYQNINDWYIDKVSLGYPIHAEGEYSAHQDPIKQPITKITPSTPIVTLAIHRIHPSNLFTGCIDVHTDLL